eukprot:308324_1
MSTVISLQQMHVLVPAYYRNLNQSFPNVLIDMTVPYTTSDSGFFLFCRALERKAYNACNNGQLSLSDMHIIRDLRIIVGDQGCMDIDEKNIKEKSQMVKGIGPYKARLLHGYWSRDCIKMSEDTFANYIIGTFAQTRQYIIAKISTNHNNKRKRRKVCREVQRINLG